MKHCLLACLYLFLGLAPANAQVLVKREKHPSFGCFSFTTLNDMLAYNKYQLLAKRISTEVTDRRRFTVFEVTDIMRAPDDAIRKGQTIRVWDPETRSVTGGPPINNAEAAETRRPGTSVILVSHNSTLTEGGVLVEAHERMMEYLKVTSAALTTNPDEMVRSAVFVPYLESKDPVIAYDALGEVVMSGYDGLKAVRDKLPRETILRELVDPTTPMIQIGHYGLLAGLCGAPEDAALLEQRIVTLEEGGRFRIEGVMAGYLLIRGADGLTVIEDSKIRALTGMTTDGKEIRLPISETYAAMQALRFIWEFEPDRISKERLRQSMRLLLDRRDLADLAITDLARWKDWSLHDRLMVMYDDDSFIVPATRRAIVRYLLHSSGEPGEIGPDGQPVRPAHAIKADEFLKRLEEQDPKTVSDASRYFRPATP